MTAANVLPPLVAILAATACSGSGNHHLVVGAPTIWLTPSTSTDPTRLHTDGRELTSADLDECHGLTSAIEWDGQTVTMYHYVLTRDFPYGVLSRNTRAKCVSAAAGRSIRANVLSYMCV
jgi:hypothetical protein